MIKGYLYAIEGNLQSTFWLTVIRNLRTCGARSCIQCSFLVRLNFRFINFENKLRKKPAGRTSLIALCFITHRLSNVVAW